MVILRFMVRSISLLCSYFHIVSDQRDLGLCISLQWKRNLQDEILGTYSLFTESSHDTTIDGDSFGECRHNETVESLVSEKPIPVLSHECVDHRLGNGTKWMSGWGHLGTDNTHKVHTECVGTWYNGGYNGVELCRQSW